MTDANIKFPVYRPHFTGLEKEYVMKCIESTWISSRGEFINEFETRFARYLGAEHAHSVSNGTVALHLALAALGIGPGDEVLVPTLTYVASANAVRYLGATPVFVDSEPDYWQIDVADARRRVSRRTKAIMPVHLYGHACDMVAIMRFAKDHELKVVEDCAEAIGTRCDGRLVGTFGDTAAFSFFGNKTITTGEGGMVVSADAAAASLVPRLRGQGLAAGREYWHDIVGYNYRMTNVAAAIGCAQMSAVEQVLARKAQLAGWYLSGLQGLPVKLHPTRIGTVHSHWMVSILVDKPADRDPLRAHLRRHGVETRPLFFPLHTMPIYESPGASFPVAVDLGKRGINLPSYPDLAHADVDEVCGRIRSYFA